MCQENHGVDPELRNKQRHGPTDFWRHIISTLKANVTLGGISKGVETNVNKMVSLFH